jgi:hypothetical protein
MHVLDKQRLLTEPRVLRRFFATKQEARLSRSRPLSHDFIGHTFREEGKPKEHEAEGEDPAPVVFIHLTNPLFKKSASEECSDEDRAKNIALLKDCIRSINKIRPKFVVVSGSNINQVARKWLGKVSETIPVAICDGSQAFNIWSWCNEVLILNGAGLAGPNESDASGEQRAWLLEELEQIKTSRRNIMAFVENDPRLVPQDVLKKLSKHRTKCVLGCAEDYFNEVYELPEVKKDTGADGNSSSDDESNQEDSVPNIKLISGILTKLSLEAKYGEWTTEDITPPSK